MSAFSISQMGMHNVESFYGHGVSETLSIQLLCGSLSSVVAAIVAAS